MTYQLVLKIINDLDIINFLISLDTSIFKSISALLPLWEKFGFCQYIQQYDVLMTSNYVMVSIKLCLDVTLMLVSWTVLKS